jgi:hypothetical protein
MQGPAHLASSNPDDLKALLRRLSTIFEDAGLRVALIGGHAVNFWGRPRFTDDVDFTVSADAEAIRIVRAELEATGFLVTRNQDSGESSGPDFVQFKRRETGDIVELQIAKTPYQELVLKRAVLLDDTQPLPVATVEDLIILKLIANRSIDHEDVIRLGATPNLDWQYVEEWCAIWEVSERLEHLRDLLAHEEANSPLA